MHPPFLYKLRGQTLWLSGQRVIFWEETKSLIVSDCHFGKTGHFRKSGIAVPQHVFKEDMQRLLHQVQHFRARRLIITGDFFHSAVNREVDFFKKWRSDLAQVELVLVKGNHDIFEDERYAGMQISLYSPEYREAEFIFCHDAAAITPGATAYGFTGHLHPGIRIKGAGRQSLQFPCFYFTKQYCVLPAFSRFTGMVSVKPEKNEQVFAIVDQQVVAFF
jgi:uncharacterized protein